MTVPVGEHMTLLDQIAEIAFQAPQHQAPWHSTPDYRAKPTPELIDLTSRHGITLCQTQLRAFYNMDADFIAIPRRRYFRSTHLFNRVLAHEMIHWTGPRLDRPLFSPQAREHGYLRPERLQEEIVAEFGSIILLQRLNLMDAPKPDDMTLLKDWLEECPRAHIPLMAQAEEAVAFLLETP